MYRKINCLLFLFVMLAYQSLAQNENRPTLRFETGDLVQSRYGVKAVIPEGWSGILPRGVEMFLLIPTDGSDGEIMISIQQPIPEDQRKANWQNGLDLGNGNVLKSDGNIYTREGGGLASNLVLAKRTTGRQGYIELNCGNNYCLTATLLASPEEFDKLRQGLYSLLESVEWGAPEDFTPYADFDWHEFLSGKHLLNHDYVPQAKFENDLWLCPDGTFTSKIKRGGLLKDQAGDYKGTKSGTWSTDAIGATGQLTLTYDKLPAVQVSLEIKDEKIYLNNNRHIAIAATNCASK